MSDLVSILKLDEGRADMPRDVASLLCRAHVEIEQLRAKLAAAEARAQKWERWAKCIRYNPSRDVQRACDMADKFAARAEGAD